jgi:glycosyltransferase involved in cell wall biosynthesis
MFIKEAIEGAFSQTYEPLEIILSDDCSSDQTFPIISEMAEAYRGPHVIILNRNRQNLGIGAHINRVMELARGELIVGAAGDDISIPERVEKIYEAYKSSKALAKSIFSNYFVIDEGGKLQGIQFNSSKKREEFLPEIIVKGDSFVSGCSHAWTREIFDVFGPLMTPLTCEDMVIPFRSALLGGIEYIHEPLVKYRHHENNISLDNKNIQKVIKHTTMEAFDRKAIYENWLKDLETMSNLSPKRETEIKHLRNIAMRRLSSAEDDIYIINSNWLKRVIMLAKKILKGEDLRGIRHKIGVFLIPGVYRKCFNLKNRINNQK